MGGGSNCLSWQAPSREDINLLDSCQNLFQIAKAWVVRVVCCAEEGDLPRFRAAPGFTGQSWCLEPSRPRAHGLPVACLCLPRPLPWCLCLQKKQDQM